MWPIMHVAILLAIISLARAAPSTKGYTVATSLPGKSAFETRRLPDAPEILKNWAGRLDIPGTTIGNSLFFWLFSAEDKAYDDNLISKTIFFYSNGINSKIFAIHSMVEWWPRLFVTRWSLP